MTTITIKTNLLRKIAPYVLFIFTVLSFFFTGSFLLALFISIATIGFIFVNTTQLFSKDRYLSYIEIFASILLVLRLIMIYNQGLFYEIIIGFIILNFILFYILHFTNVRAEDTNVLGIRKNGEFVSRKKTNIDEEDNSEMDTDNELSDFVSDDESLEDEDQDIDVESESIEEEPIDETIDTDDEIDDVIKPKQKKSKVNSGKKNVINHSKKKK